MVNNASSFVTISIGPLAVASWFVYSFLLPEHLHSLSPSLLFHLLSPPLAHPRSSPVLPDFNNPLSFLFSPLPHTSDHAHLANIQPITYPSNFAGVYPFEIVSSGTVQPLISFNFSSFTFDPGIFLRIVLSVFS